MKAFPHQFVPGESNRSLLLLHGTGGDEFDLLPLGRALDRGAALLSPRGQVMENGAARFFRRLAEGVFDEADVIARAEELASFVAELSREHGIDFAGMTAVGYSNGANIASAMLLLGVAQFSSAILLRPMVPLSNPPLVEMRGTRVLLCAGASDPFASEAEVSALAGLLRERGADVNVQTQQSGHELTSADVESARDWLATVGIA